MGMRYVPDTGASHPPFTEKVPTFDVRVVAGRGWSIRSRTDPVLA